MERKPVVYLLWITGLIRSVYLGQYWIQISSAVAITTGYYDSCLIYWKQHFEYSRCAKYTARIAKVANCCSLIGVYLHNVQSRIEFLSTFIALGPIVFHFVYIYMIINNNWSQKGVWDISFAVDCTLTHFKDILTWIICISINTSGGSY